MTTDPELVAQRIRFVLEQALEPAQVSNWKVWLAIAGGWVVPSPFELADAWASTYHAYSALIWAVGT
jgi:hypothetical protein